MRRILLYTKDDQPIGELAQADVVALVRTEELNGENSLDIGTSRVLEKGWRVLVEDGQQKWREYVVEGIDATHHDGGKALGKYHATSSMQHDLSGATVSKMPGVKTPVTAAVALEAALSGTKRWKAGDVTQATSGGASMYQVTSYEALGIVTETWGGEIHPQITVGKTGVVSRKVGLAAQMGKRNVTRRFDYGHDVRSISRKVAEEPTVCRIVPRGKGLETEDGGIERKLTIESVNAGKDYLENAATALLVRLPDGSGGWEYPTAYVDYPQIEDAAELKAAAQRDLDSYTTPKVTYEASVLQLEQAGMDVKGIALGDDVQCVDRKFMVDGLRVQGRVTKLVVNELDDTDVAVTIGYLTEDVGALLAKRFASMNASLSRMSAIQTSLETATASTKEYLDNIIDNLNDVINASGGYTYITEGQGIRTYDKAVSDPLVGAEASQVVEVKGGSIRIANSRTETGEWDWRSVFTSGHIAADMVTAANITSGYIGSPSGNYWNLDTGEMRMANTAMIGDFTVEDLTGAVEATITGVDVEYAQNQSATVAPTSGWSTSAPSWQEGHYIWQRTATTTPEGTSYSEPTCISGREGHDGTSVTVTSIQYGTSASAATEPSSWSTTAPTTIAHGTWLWVRTAYSNGSTSTTKAYVGANGADGTSVTILGSYDTLADLQAAHPTGSLGDGYIVAGDLYVWNDSSWENVGTIQGPQGEAGQDGTSVTVSSIQYGMSASASTQPASWSTTAPTSIDQGLWLWVKTNFSDGSSAVNKSYTGIDGEAATVYSITASVDAIARAADGTITPASVKFSAKSKSGSGAESAYAGRLRVQTSNNGTSWTNRYTSSADQSEYTYKPTAAIASAARYIRCILFAAGGVTTQLDTQTVAVIADGTSGTDGADAYSIVLSNESHTFAGDTSKAIAASVSSSVIAYKGGTRVAATIGSITGRPTGMTTTVSNNGTTSASFTVSVTTAMTTRNGVLSIPITVDGKSFTLTFSYALALVGEKGADGKDGSSVAIQSVSKTGGVTTVKILDSDGTVKTLTINDGEDGADGTPGASGYVHTAWATSADGSEGFSTTVSEGKTYLGVYTDNTAADSQDHTDYSWSLIKGADGKPLAWNLLRRTASLTGDDWVGARGVTCENGVIEIAGNSYADLKSDYLPYTDYSSGTYTVSFDVWADAPTTRKISFGFKKPNGMFATQNAWWAERSFSVTTEKQRVSFAFTVPDDLDKGSQDALTEDSSMAVGVPYISSKKTRFSHFKIEPGTVDSPQWGPAEADMQGEDGTGVSAIVEEYYLSTSATTQSGGSWSTDQPQWQPNRYIWTRSAVTWTDGITTTTDPVLAKAVNAANATANDAKSTANDAKSTANDAKSTANDAKGTADAVQNALAELNTQEGVFNKLTNNGALQGLYMQNGKLYVNADYIKTGSLAAELIKAGIITDKPGNNSWNLNTGELVTNDITANGVFQTDGLDSIYDIGIEYYPRTKVTGGVVEFYTRTSSTNWTKAGHIRGAHERYYANGKTVDDRSVAVQGKTDFKIGVDETASGYVPLIRTNKAYKSISMQISAYDFLNFGSDNIELRSTKSGGIYLKGLDSNGNPKKTTIAGSQLTIDCWQKQQSGALSTKKYTFTHSKFSG